MKNVHVFATDKPSRLVGSRLNLSLKDIPISGFDAFKTYNIYITSDDKFIKDEYITDGMEVIKATPKLVDAQGLVDRRDWKKIILTTDQDLIDDGVQAIGDEFLEWFVKNPSCEWVETEFFAKFGNDLYKIIIPKEEPKQETLEEVAERFFEEQEKLNFSYDSRESFVEGYKLAQQQMYSEEEVEDLIYKVCGTVARLQGITLNGNHIDTAYRQFKKK